MRQYEVTFIVDPVLSGDEIKATAQVYTDMLKKEGCIIVNVDEMGLRQLAYPINKRTSGVYYSVEYQIEDPAFINQMELAFRRDERIMRFLSVKLDKYAIKYNDDRRNGVIPKYKKKEKKEREDDRNSRGRGGKSKHHRSKSNKPATKPPVKKAEETPAPAPVAKAPEAPAPAPVAKATEEE